MGWRFHNAIEPTIVGVDLGVGVLTEGEEDEVDEAVIVSLALVPLQKKEDALSISHPSKIKPLRNRN
ncbi:hypothetical protein KFU94_22225 [Chloroflexi bacterium TSY]|nr:hypothetical protein [Chloroflexi bacterium TSY]